MDIGFEGNELSIAFNSRYLTDIIHNIDGERLCMCFNSNVSPCMIKPVEGNAFTFLVLPVRIFGSKKRKINIICNMRGNLLWRPKKAPSRSLKKADWEI